MGTATTDTVTAIEAMATGMGGTVTEEAMAMDTAMATAGVADEATVTAAAADTADQPTSKKGVRAAALTPFSWVTVTSCNGR